MNPLSPREALIEGINHQLATRGEARVRAPGNNLTLAREVAAVFEDAGWFTYVSSEAVPSMILAEYVIVSVTYFRPIRAEDATE